MRFGITRNFLTPREFSPWFQGIQGFDDVMNRFMDSSRLTPQESFNPPCDVEENDSHYVMSFDLPGVSKNDIKIEVIGNQLTVSGERKSEKRDEKNNRHLIERYYGEFTRTFELPTAIESGKVEAAFNNGVLEVMLPKAEDSKARQIKISEGHKLEQRDVKVS